MSKGISYPGRLKGIYPESEELLSGKIDQWAAGFEGFLVSRFRSKHEKFQYIVDSVNARYPQVKALSDEQILEECKNLRPRLRKEGFTDDLVSRAFALVREVAGRRLGTPHYDVQLIGGFVLLNGMVAEMETGEGKTLVATLAACTMALAGVPVHIITVNDYLAGRDADWMRPVYQGMGLTVGIIIHGLDHGERRRAYECDITYCTNKEVAFDYLRDRIVLWDRPTQIRLKVERLYGEESRINRLVMRGLHFAIIDEADSVLVDEARTPLIISTQADGLYDPDVYRHVIRIAGTLIPGKDFLVLEGQRNVELTKSGKSLARDSDWTAVPLFTGKDQREELIRQGIVALHLFKPDKQYLVKDGKIQIIDEYTGRVMADRSWEMGLHQLIEIKEECELTIPKQTQARISYQRFFRRYLGLAGMTGTAREVARELWSVYRLRVVSIPTNREVKRVHHPDSVYAGAHGKWAAVVQKVLEMKRLGRPCLIGTRSVEASEYLSGLLHKEGMRHSVLNARQDKEESDIIAKAGRIGQITVATNMAGRGTDILLQPGVAEKGGLYVIATERHESRRIDRQLFGRCARQGDPGTCEALISLEDELVQVYIPKFFLWLAAWTLKKQDSFITRWTGKIIFRLAQGSAEHLHSRARRNLLKMDDQMGDSLAFSGRFE